MPCVCGSTASCIMRERQSGKGTSVTASLMIPWYGLARLVRGRVRLRVRARVRVRVRVRVRARVRVGAPEGDAHEQRDELVQHEHLVREGHELG